MAAVTGVTRKHNRFGSKALIDEAANVFKWVITPIYLTGSLGKETPHST